MTRTHKRKTDKGLVPPEAMLDAVRRVVEHGVGLRKVAKDRGISKSTLQRYVSNYRQNKQCSMSPNYFHSQIFTNQQERLLVDYLKTASKMFHGLTTKQTRHLAFEMASRNSLGMPSTWEENKLAGKEWLTGFLKRNPTLSLRSPEATSLARSTAFNRHTVGEFFDLLESQILKTKVTGARIFNLDESGLTTVQKVPKVISEKGVKQVGQITSRERGELITVCGIVSASGVALPPVMVFPRKNYRDIFLTGAPEGTIGLAAESGWMNSDLFVSVMRHVVNTTNSSKQNPIIITMDNHESHLSMAALEMAKENGVHIITLPPHTSHKTQPLDRTVYGPLKAFFNDEANSYMMRNPGKTITIYQMGQLIDAAWLKAATPSNIISGFKVTGIWPFNRNVFGDEEFLPSSVIDRPQSNAPSQKDVNNAPGQQDAQNAPSQQDAQNAPGQQNAQIAPSLEDMEAAGPSEVPHDEGGELSHTREDKRLPKGSRKKRIQQGKEKGKNYGCNLNSGNEKNSTGVRKSRAKKARKSRKQLIKKKAQKPEEHESSSSENEEPVLLDTDEDSPIHSEDDDENEIHLGPVNFKDISSESYVLVEFVAEKSTNLAYYVAKILTIGDETDIQVDFLRKSQKVLNKFVYPAVSDRHPVDLDDIKAVLPSPVARGTTSRTKGGIVFSVNFGKLDVR
ncbi:uncharacterized protein LOC135464820 [Liolophura sinensis]|uniref:uncharacterized protein LOC135464820 n=1 Tax=Liolophura sinensis TaxID=3198878 RepID=UPI0031591CCC